ncbi:MAG: hypothetical protein QXH39_06130 [Conexivisphaerales archaeon]
MSDIRKEIEDNRGAAKKLELLIPGLKGYRKYDDLRVADDLLRHQVADKLDQARKNLESVRKQMAIVGDVSNITNIGSLISQLQELGGKVLYAQQGYAPLVASIRIDDKKLNELYEYDYEFVNAAFTLASLTAGITYDPSTIRSQIQTVSSAIDDFKNKWTIRIEAVEGIALKG